MYSECPNCHAIFRITPEILERANGNVRCGECQTVFQATPIDSDNQASEEESSLVASSLTADISGTEALDEVVISREGLSPEIQQSPSKEELELVPEPDIEVLADFSKPAAPSVRAKPTRSSSPLLTIASFVLLLTLVLQYVLANRVELAKQPGVRPVLESFCKVAGCTIPLQRDATKIVLKKHAVYSHPNVDGALMIEGVLQNDALFAQPYPVVELRLSDIRGKTVALRRFGPDEYLRLSSDIPETIAASGQAPLHLEVLDPGKNALAFEFSFL